MNKSGLRFYCDDTFERDDNEKWNYLLDYAFEKADAVEFNILYSVYQLTPEVLTLSEDLLEKSRRKDKVYPSGLSFRYALTDDVKRFIKSKSYRDWYNYCFEDISFLRNGKEFLATITHENYVILQLTESEREVLNEKGFNFWCDWGADPAAENEERARNKAPTLIERIEKFLTVNRKNKG